MNEKQRKGIFITIGAIFILVLALIVTCVVLTNKDGEEDKIRPITPGYPGPPDYSYIVGYQSNLGTLIVSEYEISNGLVFDIYSDGAVLTSGKNMVKDYCWDKYVIPNEVLGKEVKVIAEFAFVENSDLDVLYMPASIEIIDRGAFINCTKLTEIIISDIFHESTLRVGMRAFYNCKNLKTIESDIESFGFEAFEGCNKLAVRVRFDYNEEIDNSYYINEEILEYAEAIYIDKDFFTATDDGEIVGDPGLNSNESFEKDVYGNYIVYTRK